MVSPRVSSHVPVVPDAPRGPGGATLWPLRTRRNATWVEPLWLGFSPETLRWCWETSGARVPQTPWKEIRSVKAALMVPIANFQGDPPLANLAPPFLSEDFPDFPDLHGRPTDRAWSATEWADQVMSHAMNVSHDGTLILRRATSGRLYWCVEWRDDTVGDGRCARGAPLKTKLLTMDNLWAMRLALVTDTDEADRVAGELSLLLERQPASRFSAVDALASPLARPWWCALSQAGWAQVLDSPVAEVRALALVTMGQFRSVPGESPVLSTLATLAATPVTTPVTTTPARSRR